MRRRCMGGVGPCSGDGYAIPPSSRCEAHGAYKSGWTRYGRQHPERARLYASSDWRYRRQAHLKANPSCVVCGESATHADHITPLSEGGDFDGPIQSLCEEHHRQKTSAESRRGNKRAAERRRGR